MVIDDDRTAEQKESHYWLIVGTDKFLSGWGKADGGASYAAWATDDEHRAKVLDWVESRSDMKRVREVFGEYRPRGRGHLHIYVVNPGHASIVRCQCPQCAPVCVPGS